MPFPPADASDFRRIAVERLEDAECLLRGNRTTGAVYIVGYVVECGLKAVLLRYTPSRSKDATLNEFKGSRGHDLEYWRHQCRIRSVPQWNKDVRKAFARVNTTRQLEIGKGMRRYDPGRAGFQDARDLIDAARTFLAWSEGQLS